MSVRPPRNAGYEKPLYLYFAYRRRQKCKLSRRSTQTNSITNFLFCKTAHTRTAIQYDIQAEMFVTNIVLHNTKSYQAVEYTLQYIDTRIENMMYMVHIEKTTIEWKIVLHSVHSTCLMSTVSKQKTVQYTMLTYCLHRKLNI